MKKITVTLLMIISAICVHAEITQVNNMREVIENFQNADSDTLVIFDIDLVLIQPSDPAFQLANMKLHSAVAKKIYKEIPVEKQMIFLSLSTIKTDPILVDAQIPQMLADLRAREVPTMALTANLTGQFSVIDNMEVWRIKCLQELGIDFSHSAPYKQTVTFNKLPTYRGNHPTYVGGIMFANGTACSKGDALLAFLEIAQLSPKKIIFIDDSLDNLKSIEAAMQSKHVECMTLHYLGAKAFPSEMLTEDQFTARWRELAEEAKGIY